MSKRSKQKQEQVARIEARNEKIKEMHDRLINEKYSGVRRFTEDYVLLKVGEAFFLSPRTVENIVYDRLKKPESNQTGEIDFPE